VPYRDDDGISPRCTHSPAARSRVGRFEEGTRRHEASLEAYRRLGDERGVGEVLALTTLGEIERVDGNFWSG
jgi:hypothetical protein